MSTTVAGQLHALIGALLLGVAAGAWYDLLRGLRHRLTHTAATVVLDLLFWLVSTAALFLWSISAGDGQVQYSVCAAVLLGGAGYFRFLSRLCFPLLSAAAGILLLPLTALGKLQKFLIKICKKHFSFRRK